MYKQETSNNQVFPTSSIESIDIQWNIGNEGTDTGNPAEKNSLDSRKKLKEMCNVVMCDIVEKNSQSKLTEDQRDENGKIVMCDIVEQNSNGCISSKEYNQPNVELPIAKDNPVEPTMVLATMPNNVPYPNVNSFSFTAEMQIQEIESLTNQKSRDNYLQNSTTKFLENSRGLYYDEKLFMNCIVRISKNLEMAYG